MGEDEQAGEEVPVDGGIEGSGGGVSSKAIAAKPEGFVVTGQSPNFLTLLWNDRATNELIFEVERCTGFDCDDFVPLAHSPLARDSETITDSGLTSSTAYSYRIRTTNRNGSSAWVVLKNVTTFQNPNENLNVSSISSTAVSFAWSPTSSEYSGVRIQRCTGSGCESFQDVFGSPFTGALTQYTEANLSPSTTYRFRIRTISEGTESDWLTSHDVTTASSTTTATPSNFTVVENGSTSVQLGWTDNASGEIIYEVQSCTGASCSNFTSAAGSPLVANSTAYVGTGLSPETYYTFRVRATGPDGSSPWVTTPSLLTGPNAPTSLVVEARTSSSITFSWSDQSSDETGFDIQHCSGSGCMNFSTSPSSPVATNTTSFTVTGLSAANSHEVRVRAVKSGSYSDWLTSGSVTTHPAMSSCSSPKTYVVDAGNKSNSTNTGRGLWSDTKVIPGTRLPATAFYDGSATGGAASVKLTWWNGSKFIVESVAGDSRVTVGSATYVRLAFLADGRPLVFWTTGSTIVKGAVRSASLSSAGTWASAVVDTVPGAASRALEVAVSPQNQVGLIYLTNTTTAGRARFIYCASGCGNLSQYVAMNSNADTIEASNVIAATQATGIAWCKQNSSTYYPAVVYPGNAGASIRYASCLQSDLNNCRTSAGWSGQATTVVSTAGVVSKMYIDSSVVGDAPKIITRNAGNTLLQAFQMNQACNASPAYSFTAGNTFGAATSANAWLSLVKDLSGEFHVAANLGTTAVHYHNSVSTNFASTTWNAAGVVDTIAQAAAGSAAGGADINNTDRQLYVSYGGSTAPFNINLGVVADTNVASNSGSAVFYSMVADLSGGINIALATGNMRNVSLKTTSDGKPAVAYVDTSNGTAAGSLLKYAYRDGLTAASSWKRVMIPNTGTPYFPSLAFDHNNKPWISYYDGGNFKYYLVTNSETDGSGTWSFYQFPINAKTASAAAPATDDTALAMYYSGGVSYPVMVAINSTAAGGTGVRAAYFSPSVGAFTSYSTIDALGASYATRLTIDSDTTGTIAVAFYDLTSTRTKFSYSTNGTTWTTTPVSSANTGREGLSIKLSPIDGHPSMSYYDRANDTLYFATCEMPLSSCSSTGNWTITSAANSLGVSGVGAANEQLLNSSLVMSVDGAPYISFIEGVGAATQRLAYASNGGGSFASTTLVAAPTSGVSGAATVNFAMTGFNVSSALSSLGKYISAYVGPNNWLYATSCGE